MNQQQVITFLVAHRNDLGEKLQNAPEEWLFHESKLPAEIRATIPPHKIALLLVEDDEDERWYIVD